MKAKCAAAAAQHALARFRTRPGATNLKRSTFGAPGIYLFSTMTPTAPRLKKRTCRQISVSLRATGSSRGRKLADCSSYLILRRDRRTFAANMNVGHHFGGLYVTLLARRQSSTSLADRHAALGTRVCTAGLLACPGTARLLKPSKKMSWKVRCRPACKAEEGKL